LIDPFESALRQALSAVLFLPALAGARSGARNCSWLSIYVWRPLVMGS